MRVGVSVLQPIIGIDRRIIGLGKEEITMGQMGRQYYTVRWLWGAHVDEREEARGRCIVGGSGVRYRWMYLQAG